MFAKSKETAPNALLQKKPHHFLTGEELNAEETAKILHRAMVLKHNRQLNLFESALSGCHLALLFDKPSLRTRFSFSVAMRELGGDVIESCESTRKKETPEDQALVLSGYCQAIMIRTHEESVIERMSQVAKIPVINGLSNLHHPCQILADLMTLQEVFGALKNLLLCYVGDGNNILHSLLLMAPKMGVTIHYCCPKERQPDPGILQKSLWLADSNMEQSGKIKSFSSPSDAVKNVDAVYTDVWTSMGFEDSAADHLFDGFQVNENLMKNAKANAIFMHCLPMERGKEVSETLPQSEYSVIYQQSENRLHVQKSLLSYLLKRK